MVVIVCFVLCWKHDRQVVIWVAIAAGQLLTGSE